MDRPRRDAENADVTLRHASTRPPSFEQRFERRLAQELGTLRFDLMKWSFLFWIGQLAALSAILSVLIRR